MKFKQMMFKAGRKVAQHSPAILTGVGVVGLGATAYLAYKSRNKVEAVVEEVERKNDLEQPINKVEVARGIADAIYQPVLVGAGSIACILLAHRIQHRRILTLTGALVAEQTRNAYFQNKYKQQHGEEAYNKFITPTREEEHIEVNKNGKEKKTVQEVKADIDKSIGEWYSESTEYASDDHDYNVAMIDTVHEKLQTIMFQRGQLTLNEVREALGFERIRSGALLGWSTGDGFQIDKIVSMIGDEAIEAKEQIWVTWTYPRYIYDEIEFNGRYSIQ